MFFYGIVGSAGLEIVYLAKAYEVGPVPERYRRVWFWVTRAALAILGGLIALAYCTTYSIYNPILALQVGATAPAVITSLAQRAPDVVSPSQDKAATSPPQARKRTRGESAPEPTPGEPPNTSAS